MGRGKDPAEVLKAALELPIEARAALIDSLIESLDHTIDDDTEDAWREEIYRRLSRSMVERFNSRRGRTRVGVYAVGSNVDERIGSNSPCRFREGRGGNRMVPAAQQTRCEVVPG